MPFQSEKQRRYLWANEPEIARDWTDTYGSRIEKNDGGIIGLRNGGRIGLYQGGGPHGGKPQGKSSTSSKGSDRGGFEETQKAGKSYEEKKAQGKADEWQKDALKQHKTQQKVRKHAEEKKERYKSIKEKAKTKKESRLRKFEKKVIANFVKRNKYKNLKRAGVYGTPGFKGLFSELWSGMSPPDEVENFDVDSIREIASRYGGDLSKTQVKGLGGFRKDLDFEKQFPDATTKEMRDYYGLDKSPIPGGGGGGGYMGYPSYEAWLAAQGGGGGGGTTVPPVEEESEFQKSLTTTADTPDYYVGNNPLASNIAWGKQMGVDPRTMGLTSWADGGRIGRAYGGIMDTETGRRAYGLGSIFKSIKKAAGKVLKSPIGKAALIGGLGWAANAGWLGGGMKGWVPGLKQMAMDKKWLGNMLLNTDRTGWSLGKLGILGAGALPFFMGDEEEDEGSKFDYEGAKNAYRDELMRIKRGAMAGTLDPNEFNYLGVKDGGRIGLSNGGDPMLVEEYKKYVFEMEELGLEPMSFEQFKEQARAGMYAGGQSTPSDYTMEDALMTTTQDKLGGITDVMKQADLYRQGSVGQFYAADGGSASDRHEIKIQELMDKGLSRELAEALVLSELSSDAYSITDKAQGGRIGYDAGGQTGHPPITMGQVPQVPQTPPQMPGPHAPPMPAPQPNQMGRGMMGGMNPMGRGMMGGMNPMMNSPVMKRPMMGGRMMAQEGGLMDLGGMEKDYRNDGGFVPIGGEEKADDVPARLSRNEFVFTADAVRGAGGGDIDKGAEIMENVMKNLEQGGEISEETQGLAGAQEMFGVSERLSEVV